MLIPVYEAFISCDYLVCIVLDDQRPDSNDLNRFLIDYCKHWRAIGLKLGLVSSVLDQVEADYHSLSERFRVTLEKWLQLNVGVTWANLELAITNAIRDSLGLNPLSTGKENVSVYVCVCVCVCVCVWARVCACMYMCTCLFVHAHTSL